MDRYERLERIDYKSARDVVTEADHLSEALIIDAIRARHPGDAILAEETGEHRAVAGEAPTCGRGRVWIIDPLDGTVNYANGIPFFCVSIGLVVDGRPSRRRRPRPDPRTRRSRPRPTGRPCCRRARAGEPRDHGLGQGQAVRLRHLDGAQRAVGRDAARGPSARRSASRARWARRPSPWPTSPTAGSMRSSSRAGCRPGTSPRPASSPSAAGRGHAHGRRPVVRLRPRAPRRSASWRRPGAHHAALLDLVR